MMSGEGEEKVVCVTGASGFVASWLVKLLLQRGYTVKATVRDPNSPKTEHLRELDGAKERLHLFKANLLEEGSFDSAVDGCDGVFHTASPVIFLSDNPQEWYSLAKTLAEEAAWKFAKENGIDLVAIHPGTVIGPFFQPILNFGAEVILNLINGDQSFAFPYVFVEIRDVVYAHIRALEVPKASGRYLLAGSVAQHSDILKFLHEHYPTLLRSGKLEEKYQPTIKVSQERAKSLGINFTPWEVGVRGCIESLMEKGFLS
ncbi:Epimerase domain-containing protein [Citrus sinensis]|uniref:Epimerase domain-containing protein n=1 Tax=Citrus sinensis TaxID=2711 RepID=A0ACB8LMA3_CITSI|nr:Epimerase domain-containing protein [Citrus sinensis]